MLHQTLLLIRTSVYHFCGNKSVKFQGVSVFLWNCLDAGCWMSDFSNPGFEALKRTWVQPSISITEVGKGDST